jgi:cellulose synthase/poly-beta-1,6-N-acetylglucosamine synthase-like glycosyltransferase
MTFISKGGSLQLDSNLLPGENVGQSGISLILPCYNEERQIYAMIAESHQAALSLGMEFEIIVVNDGSDAPTTAEIERAVSHFDRVTAVMLPENQGKGNALHRGFQASQMDLVAFIDADLDLHPRQIENLLGEMERTGVDVVIGSKRHKESTLDYPWYRKLFSTVYYLLILVLFRLPVRDTQTGMKLFRRHVLELSFPRIVAKKYTLDLELLVVAHKLGFRIGEAPIELTFHGERLGWPSIRNIVTDTMAVFYRLNILRYYSTDMRPISRKEPSVSIVMATDQPEGAIEPFLARCAELNYSNFDIKIASGTPVASSGAPRDLEIVVCPTSGLPAKRDAAAARSNSEILAFVDEDSVPDIDWLKNAAAYFEDVEVAAVCGPAILPAVGTRRQLAGGMAYSSSMVSGTTTYRYTRHALREVDDYPAFNFLVRRSDFLQAGGFPEELAPGEDTILCLNLTRKLGKKIIYVPNVIIHEHRAPLFVPHLRNVYRFARSRGSFVRRYPETSRRLPYFIPSILLLFLIVGLGLSFASRWILYVYLGCISVYLFSALLASVKSLDLLINALVFPGIIATNFVYGYGFLLGLLAPGPGKAGGQDSCFVKVHETD